MPTTRNNNNSETRKQLRPPTFRDDLLAALHERGYVRLSYELLRLRGRPLGFDELLSPEPTTGRPLTARRHSILLGSNGGLHLLRAGASMEYAIPLPDRTIDLLLEKV